MHGHEVIDEATPAVREDSLQSYGTDEQVHVRQWPVIISIRLLCVVVDDDDDDCDDDDDFVAVVVAVVAVAV